GLGLYEVLRALLNTYFDFVTPLIAPIANSLAVIVAVVLLAPRWGILGLVAGALLGAALQSLLPALIWHSRHLRLKLTFALENPEFRQLVRLSGWSALLVLLGQLTFITDRVI